MRHECINHVESVMLKFYKIAKSCYHAGNLEGNDIRRLVAKGIVVFVEIQNYLISNKPSNIKDDEIILICSNYTRLCSLMDGIFSALRSKRVDVTDEKIKVLKSDLNLVRLKWKVQFSHCHLHHVNILTFSFILTKMH